jgi:hypothetical protein
MNKTNVISGIICISVALFVMFLLMHYAPFYAPSYIFWIGVILALIGVISLLKPLVFLFIFNRLIATVVLSVAIALAVTALYWPVPVFNSTSDRKIDALLPSYSFNEYHEVLVKASQEAVKEALQTTTVGDIPVIRLLIKIRGIDNKQAKDIGAITTKNQAGSEIFSTPDFNFFVADSSELIAVMLLNASTNTPPPPVKTLEQFRTFNKPGYIKVAINFRFIAQRDGRTLITTETRNYAMTKEDARLFGRYWRIVYPGSAIIRRVWLDALAKRAKNLSRN